MASAQQGNRRLWMAVGLALALIAALAPATAAQVGGTLDTSASATDLALTISTEPGTVVGATFEARPGGSPTAAATLPLASFPLAGADYAILSTGNAAFADNANTSGSTGANNGGGPVRGNTDRDVVILRIDLQVPSTVNCLVGLDFRFLSDEYPEFVGSSFNDAFIAELDESTWTTSGSTISAPDNFAFDPTGSPISINGAGVTSMSAAQATGTTYDGATPILTAATPITPGAHSLYLSIFDQGDNAYDSAVFLDALRFGRVADVARDCRPGAVQRDPDQARPLLGAHGITGVPADMEGVLGFARELVPSLDATYSADTGRITSVWDNGLQVWQDAVDITRQSGQPTTNVIAHSKGGLDSRVALWEHPRQFSALGMLATPNGGSKGANKLCGLRRLGNDSVESQFGPCIDDTDGLYNLQTSYMEDVFNEIVRDWPQHSLFVAAGDCTGFGRIKCNASSQLLLGCDSRGGDTAVCVSSAFNNDTFEGRGEHFPLDPVFDADHTAMRATGCPVSRMLAVLYGGRNDGNPWVGGDGSGCEDLTFTSAGNQFAAEAAVGAEVEQSLTLLTAAPDAPAVLSVDPEGGDQMTVEVFMPAGTVGDITVTHPDGTPDAQVQRQDGEIFGEQATTLVLTGLDAQPRTITIDVDGPTEVGFATSVASGGITATSHVEPAGPDSATVSVTVNGMLPPDQRFSVVQATVPTQSGPVTVPLSIVGNPSGAEHQRSWIGRVPAQPGDMTPVDIVLSGPRSRVLHDGVVLPDGSATLDGLSGDQLVDSDGDGVIDSLAIAVDVTVGVADDYQLAVDLTTPEGVAFSAPGRAALAEGPQVIEVVAPIEALVAGGADGPYQVRHAVLTRGTDRRRVAESDLLGTTGPYVLGDLHPDRPVLSRPVGQAVDTDGDGWSDEVHFTSLLGLPATGSHEVAATLQAPDGTVVDAVAEARDLPAGVSQLLLVFDAASVIDLGPGRYTVTDLTVTAAADPAVTATAPPAGLDITDVSRFVGAVPDPQTLILQWRQAFAAGEIPQRGLYVSELQRLQRVDSRADGGDVTGAVAELDLFVAHLEDRTPDRIDAVAAERLTSYALAVRDQLIGG